MNRWISFGVGALVVGAAAYNIYYTNAPMYATLNPGGKFLGIIEEKAGFNLDDIAKGAALVLLAGFGIKLAHMAGLPASTSLPV